jgi:hypothetical protein
MEGFKVSEFYNKLQFSNLKSANTFENIKSLGVDKIHYSGDFPTVFFKEVKSFNQKTLKEIAETHHNLWNYKKVLFLYVTSKTEIKIYNCSSKPFNYQDEKINIEEELKKIELASSDIDKLDRLLEIFSASAIDSGSIWIRDNIYLKQLKEDKKIDNFLVASLVQTAKELKKQGLDLDVVHALIMRSLFIMYLEDKGATPEEFYEKEKQNAHSYFDLLEDKEATYHFFEKIKENFNGNVFPVSAIEKKSVELHHLALIKRCFINGNIKRETLFSDWRIFKFDIIQIELLSEIYEKFLGEIQKETGSYYTPPALVELILNETLPIKNSETEYDLKILDPTCGSGIFLVEAYKRIVKRWENANPNKDLDFKILKELMQNSIYGIELNPKSIKVASFSLYLSLLDFLNPKNLWHLNGEKFPYLINDEDDENIEVQGYNLFRTDTIEDNEKFEKEYDLIVGNPPYAKSKIPDNIKEYCKKYNFSKEFVIPFIHKSTLLAPNGKIALLATTKLLTNTAGTSQNFREWLFNDNYVEKVYNLSILRKAPKTFGGSLFSSAVVPATIFFFQKEAPQKKSKTIEYWAPKTYIKNHIAEGVLIDSSDIKFLPRKECQKPDTKIWKIAQWGTLNDFMLISSLDRLDRLDTYIDKEKFGGGFQRKKNGTENLNIKKTPFIDTQKLNLYYTEKSQTEIIEDISFERLGTIEAYKAPHLLIKEGIKKININQKKDYRIISSFLDYDCSFYKGIIGIHHKDERVLKALVGYFNSTFTKYLMFLTSASWGIERDVIKSNELLIPNFLNKNMTVENLHKCFNEIFQVEKTHYPLSVDISSIENKIDNEIFSFFNLSEDERISIYDNIKYSIDLFDKGHKSMAVRPLDKEESELYTIKLCEKINKVLDDSDMKLIAKVYIPSYYNPLSLIRFQFVEKNSNKEIEVVSVDSEFDKSLSKLNQFTLDKYSKSIYMQKNITYYDDDLIYIIKPNQKRFWTQSQAIEDAQNITLEIMSMNNG